MNNPNIRIIKSSEYSKLLDGPNETIGISHHPAGLGKLKVFDKSQGIEYGVPVQDIMSRNLSEWRIEKR